MKPNPKTYLILGCLFILIVALMAIPSYQLLVKPRGQAFDLFWIWAGGQAILTGENPYGPETTRVIQLGVFKKIIPPHQYQHGFPHPAHIAFILLPFVALPFSWSVLAWISLQIPLFMVTMLMGFNVLNWSVRPSVLFLLAFLSTVGFRYPINVYVLGQLIFFVMFCFVLSTWLYQQSHPRWAAIVLACATIRPDISLLALLLATMLTRRSSQRNQFIFALVVTGIIFTVLPMFFIGPLWPYTWVNALFSYGSNPFATWPPELLPSIGLQAVLLIGLIAWVVRYFWLERQAPSDFHKSLLVSAVILGGLIILPQTGSYSLTLALVPAMILLRYAPRRWLQVSIVASLLTPWLYFALGSSFDRFIFLLIPGQFILLQELVMYTNKTQTLPQKPLHHQKI